VCRDLSILWQNHTACGWLASVDVDGSIVKLYTTGSEEMGHFVTQSFSRAGLNDTEPIPTEPTNKNKGAVVEP
jgi:hypothetical protein